MSVFNFSWSLFSHNSIEIYVYFGRLFVWHNLLFFFDSPLCYWDYLVLVSTLRFSRLFCHPLSSCKRIALLPTVLKKRPEMLEAHPALARRLKENQRGRELQAGTISWLGLVLISYLYILCVLCKKIC